MQKLTHLSRSKSNNVYNSLFVFLRSRCKNSLISNTSNYLNFITTNDYPILTHETAKLISQTFFEPIFVKHQTIVCIIFFAVLIYI